MKVWFWWWSKRKGSEMSQSCVKTKNLRDSISDVRVFAIRIFATVFDDTLPFVDHQIGAVDTCEMSKIKCKSKKHPPMERTRNGTTHKIEANRIPKKNMKPKAVAQDMNGRQQAAMANKT